jgi:citronellol/citronellal dehydrogenase
MGDRKKVVPSNWKSCFRTDLFKNKTALVTGGGTGIGRSIAIELALLGATVVIASRSVDKCEKTAREINAFLGNSSMVVAW